MAFIRSGNGVRDRAVRAPDLITVLALCALSVAGSSSSALAAGSVYVGNVNGANVSQYTIGLGGALTPITPATVAAEHHPQDVAISPNAKSVYVLNFESESLSQYDLGPGGALTPKSPPTVKTAPAPGSQVGVSG